MIQAFNFSFRQRVKLGFNNTLFGLSGTLFNFVLSIIVVRLFSPQLWGSFTQAMLLISLFGLLTSWGNKDFLVRELSRSTHLVFLWQTSILSRALVFALVAPFIFLNFIPIDPLIFLLCLLANFILRSFDSLVVFERKFREAQGIELAGFLLITGSLFLFRYGMSIELLIVLFTATTLLKSVCFVALFQKPYFSSFEGAFSRSQLVACIPYLLPPFIGFLQSKADTFAIAIKLPKKDLGEYFLLLNLLSYCHAVAILGISPFLKNIYRINSVSFQKIKRNFILMGMIWSVICILGIYCILTFIYRVQLSSRTYWIAWMALLPYFAYYLLMQQLLRQDRPYTIVVLNLIAAIFNFVISLFLIDRYGFEGGLMSCALLQWVLLAGFLVAHRLREPALNLRI